MEFWNTKKGIPQEHHRKVMVIPNITNSSNLEADSFIDVIENHISNLGDDFFWYIPLPERVKRLEKFDNVEQIMINMSGNMFHMRVSFPTDIIKLLQKSSMDPTNKGNAKLHREYDVVYSHLPDWSVRRFVPTKKKIIGYCHWWEMPICNGISNMNNYLNLEAEIIGTLQMERLYVNTVTQKNAVIEAAKLSFNHQKINDLERIIQPFYLSLPKEELVNSVNDNYEKTIVFNHRCKEYKGFPQFMKLMFEYRKTRQDFNLWITMGDKYGVKYDEPWISTEYLSKRDYFDALPNKAVVVTPYETHFGWSIAATDAMMKGVPVLFEECDNYRELHETGFFYKNKEELFKGLDKCLDDVEWRNKIATYGLERAERLANTNQFEELKNLLLP